MASTNVFEDKTSNRVIYRLTPEKTLLVLEKFSQFDFYIMTDTGGGIGDVQQDMIGTVGIPLRDNVFGAITKILTPFCGTEQARKIRRSVYDWCKVRSPRMSKRIKGKS